MIRRGGKAPVSWRSDSGAAAIEFVIMLPVLALVFLGMVDFSLALRETRRLAYAANVMGDLVTRNDNSVNATDIDDYVNAVAIAMRPRPISEVRVQVTGYRRQNNVTTLLWQRSNNAGPACTAPDLTSLPGLMVDSNDVVLTLVCAQYTPQLVAALAPNLLGSAAFTITEQVVQRPRGTLTLTCTGC
jgi:Flp pilus assembly protein TadG